MLNYMLTHKFAFAILATIIILFIFFLLRELICVFLKIPTIIVHLETQQLRQEEMDKKLQLLIDLNKKEV